MWKEEDVKLALWELISKKMLVIETAQSFNVPKRLLHNSLTGIIYRSETELLLALWSLGYTFSQEAQSQLFRRVIEPDIYLLPSKGRIPINWHMTWPKIRIFFNIWKLRQVCWKKIYYYKLLLFNNYASQLCLRNAKSASLKIAAPF